MAEVAEVRAAAVRLILGVTEGQVALNEQLQKGALAALPPPDRARAQRLAMAVLRQIGPINTLLKSFLRKEPPPYVRALLQLATAELLADGAAAHGIVHEVVGLTRAPGQRTDGFAGLVNAVLRRVSELPPDALVSAQAQQLPGWLRGRLMSAWGKQATMRMEAAHAAGAAIDLTPKDGDGAALAARLGAQLLPTGSVRLTASAHVSDLPGYAEGGWWVQDAAAALPARAVAARPGEQILDLCCAPGGKTLQLAAAGAEVTALDLSAARMVRVEENLKRCHLSARTVVEDALTWRADRLFDAVLLDAPCSATGTIRRHPDLPFVKDATGLKDLFALQAALIDRALGCLRPGGRLVFATCSLLPDEGERQVSAALGRHEGLTIDRAAVALPGILPEWASVEGGLRLRPDFWPELGGMDGFYIAAFRRPG